MEIVVYCFSLSLYLDRLNSCIHALNLNLNFSWLNTVCDTCVSFPFFSKTLDPLVTKNGSKQVNNTNVGFFIVKYKQPFKIGFVYLQKI